MKLVEKIIRIIILVGVAVYMLLAIKENDWTQGIFWLLTIFLLETLPSISFKKDKK